MSLWLVRAGRNGEQEDFALEKNMVVIGWDELPDISTIKTRDDLEKLCSETYPAAKLNTVKNWARQLWTFKDTIQIGDYVVLPLKKRSALVLGTIAGNYEFHPEFPLGAHNARKVKWIAEIPRNVVDQDLLNSLGAFLTVCKIDRNNAEKRIVALAKGKPQKPALEAEEELKQANLTEQSVDEIRKFIGQKFSGHNLARLVDGVLRAQGYYTNVSSPGPDGGVDILAGMGRMGFGEPRICVQVKSGAQASDIKVFRELIGTMQNFKAQQGLLVSWSGFKRTVVEEAKRQFFNVRLWDDGDLIEAIEENYENLPEDLQAEIPLKKIWTLVKEDE